MVAKSITRGHKTTVTMHYIALQYLSLGDLFAIYNLTLCVRKPTTWVPTRSDTNQPVQSQKQARSLNIQFKKKKDCAIHAAKTKALTSCAVTAQLICGFVFAYANCWFSHVVAQL